VAPRKVYSPLTEVDSVKGFFVVRKENKHMRSMYLFSSERTTRKSESAKHDWRDSDRIFESAALKSENAKHDWRDSDRIFESAALKSENAKHD